MTFLQRVCPICETSRATDREIYSMPQAETLSLEDMTSHWAGFFKDKVIFSYHRCQCGLLYCPTFFNESQLANLYASMEDNTAGVPLSPLLKTQRDYYKSLKPHINVGGDYLELGPDIGLFATSVLKENKFKSCWILEPNRAVWPVLQENMGQQSHHILSDLEELNTIPDASISTMVMIHVLDHLLDPGNALRLIKKKLVKGAVLLFVTHDERSLLARTTKMKWPAYCLQHPQLFNRQSISTLLMQAGFEVINCKKSYNYFPITYLVKHFCWLFNFKLKIPEFAWFSVKLKLGNIITIASNND